MKLNVVKCAVGMVVALGLLASSASAQATRTWVSGVGDDANPCSRTAPCKTFAGAISKTAAGGEIDALDPGGFGAVTITKSITIDMGGFTGGVLNASANGIIINLAASTDVVILRNIVVQGAGSGLGGIKILGIGGTVHLEKCAISGQANKGIECTNSTGALRLFINDCTIRNNKNGATGGGILLKPTPPRVVQCYMNRTTIEKNTFGMRAEDNCTVLAKDCEFSGNDTHGVVSRTAGGASIINLDSCVVSKNTLSGLRVENAASTIRYSNCTIDHNATGLDPLGGGAILSFQNNRNVGNTTPGAPTGTLNLE